MPKNSKRGHYKAKTSKNAIPFDRIRKLSKRSRIVPKKSQRWDPLVSPLILEALKHLRFSARIEPTISCFSEN